MFDKVFAILQHPPKKIQLPPLDEQFYRSARRVKLTGRLKSSDIFGLVIQNIEADVLGNPRVVIELDSDGVASEMGLTAIRSTLSHMTTFCDVRIIARGTCASSAMFIMNGVPEECRYATPGLKVWVDAGNFPQEIRRTLSSDQLKLADKQFANGKRQEYSMEDAAKKLKLFKTVLDVDWLD